MTTASWSSVIHSLVCLPLCIAALVDVGWWSSYASPPPPNPNKIDVYFFWFLTTGKTRQCIFFSAVYFGWELAVELKKYAKGRGQFDNLCHALMSSTAYCFIGWYLELGHITLCLALVSELSTPFLNLFYLARDREYRLAPPTKPLTPPALTEIGDVLNLAADIAHHSQSNATPGKTVYTTNQVSAIVEKVAHEQNELRAKLKWQREWAQVAFAVAFFLVRIVWQPLIVYYSVSPYIVAGWDMVDTRCSGGICLRPAVVAAAEFTVSVLLNFYWFGLILAAAARRSKPPSSSSTTNKPHAK